MDILSSSNIFGLISFLIKYNQAQFSGNIIYIIYINIIVTYYWLSLTDWPKGCIPSLFAFSFTSCDPSKPSRCKMIFVSGFCFEHCKNIWSKIQDIFMIEQASSNCTDLLMIVKNVITHCILNNGWFQITGKYRCINQILFLHRTDTFVIVSTHLDTLKLTECIKTQRSIQKVHL